VLAIGQHAVLVEKDKAEERQKVGGVLRLTLVRVLVGQVSTWGRGQY
jgi:hypothetical protein